MIPAEAAEETGRLANGRGGGRATHHVEVLAGGPGHMHGGQTAALAVDAGGRVVDAAAAVGVDREEGRAHNAGVEAAAHRKALPAHCPLRLTPDPAYPKHKLLSTEP